MTSDVSRIESFYEAGMKAMDDCEYTIAANMFKACWDCYQNADFSFYHEDTKATAFLALEKYKFITARHLKPGEYDELDYWQ